MSGTGYSLEARFGSMLSVLRACRLSVLMNWSSQYFSVQVRASSTDYLALSSIHLSAPSRTPLCSFRSLSSCRTVGAHASQTTLVFSPYLSLASPLISSFPIVSNGEAQKILGRIRRGPMIISHYRVFVAFYFAFSMLKS